MELRDAVSIVTGGSGGLGRRICHALARAGSHVAVVYARGREEALDVVGQMRDLGVEAEAFGCDVSDARQVQTLVERVLGTFGRVDILVNDASYYKQRLFNDVDGITLEEWNRMLNVNLTGPMLCMKAVAPAMRRQGAGRIVNVSTVSALLSSGLSIPYVVSKGGLIHLTRCMAVAMAPEILVNCIAPGYMAGTRATGNMTPDAQERAREGSLLNRPVDKDDVANQIVAFCTTDSVTGQTLAIDCGRAFH